MKSPYEVQFLHTHEKLSWVTVEDAWSLRKDFRWKWLARLAEWLIRKIGVNAREPKVEVQRILIDPPRIMEKIFKQRSALFDMGQEPKRLLIGAEDFSELMRLPEVRDYLTIDAEYHKRTHGGHRICDLRIEVIPWMRGCLVMP